MSENFKMYTCPVCGRQYRLIEARTWAYKTTNKVTKRVSYYCSWKCMRKEKSDGRLNKQTGGD